MTSIGNHAELDKLHVTDSESELDALLPDPVELPGLTETLRCSMHYFELFCDELSRVGRPLDDVDLLAVELVDDVLDAYPAHANTGADGVDLLLPRGDGDLGTEARLAGDLHDLDRAGEDLRDLLLEETANEPRMGA